MKTSRLTGAALDWAVQQCEGQRTDIDFAWWYEDYTPSTNWTQGGLIVERECIDLQYQGGETDVWAADMFNADSMVYGDTPLIAAMRCYVTSVMGDEIDVPEELKEVVYE